MSDKDDLEKSRKNEKEKLEGFIQFSKKADDLVPDAQRRLRDLKAQDELMNVLPEDDAEEAASKALPYQLDSEKKAATYLPQPSHIGIEARRYLGGSTGTNTVLSEYVNTIYEYKGVTLPWVKAAKYMMVSWASKCKL